MPPTFRLVAQCLNQLRHRAPPISSEYIRLISDEFYCPRIGTNDNRVLLLTSDTEIKKYRYYIILWPVDIFAIDLSLVPKWLLTSEAHYFMEG
jgi:hypothetical protein